MAHLQARGLGGRLPRDHQVSDTVIRTVQNFVQARQRRAGRPGRCGHPAAVITSAVAWLLGFCGRASALPWARGLRMLSRLRTRLLTYPSVREEKDVERKKSRG